MDPQHQTFAVIGGVAKKKKIRPTQYSTERFYTNGVLYLLQAKSDGQLPTEFKFVSLGFLDSRLWLTLAAGTLIPCPHDSIGDQCLRVSRRAHS